MNLNNAQSYKGKLSQAAINTFADIAQSIEAAGKRTPWEIMNTYMQQAMLEAKAEASNKAEFVKLAKAKTGLTKSNDSRIVWCVTEWF